MKYLKKSLLLLITIVLVSCQSSSGPPISQIILKNDKDGIILNTKDQSILAAFQKDFYQKKEFPEGDPNFQYLLDITSNGKSTRWQYNPDGKIRIFELNSKIYKIENVSSFNKTLTIN